MFVPEDLPNVPMDGEESGLTLVGFTLIEGASGPELYAAVRNDAETPVCEGGLMTSFFDKTGQLVTMAASVLESGAWYRLDGGTGATISCIAPGQIAMTASTDLPETLVIDELGHLEHRFPAFVVAGIVPVEGLSLTNVEPVTSAGGTAYGGTLTNGFDVGVSAPSVSVFPVNAVGRPLGVATSSADVNLPPGGTWSFETGSVAAAGVDFRAYPTATLADAAP